MSVRGWLGMLNRPDVDNEIVIPPSESARLVALNDSRLRRGR